MLIFSSGDMSPFELRISRAYDREEITLRRDLTGAFEIVANEN